MGPVSRPLRVLAAPLVAVLLAQADLIGAAAERAATAAERAAADLRLLAILTRAAP